MPELSFINLYTDNAHNLNIFKNGKIFFNLGSLIAVEEASLNLREDIEKGK